MFGDISGADIIQGSFWLRPGKPELALDREHWKNGKEESSYFMDFMNTLK